MAELLWLMPLHALAAPTRAAEFCPHDNFQTTLRISFIFGRIDGPDFSIAWLDLVDFRRDLDLEFSRSNMEFPIS